MTLYWAGRLIAASSGLVLLLSPDPRVCVPLLPTYAIVTDRVGVIARCILKFHASTVGRRKLLGRALMLTLNAGAGSSPLSGTVGNTFGAGPPVAGWPAAGVQFGWPGPR